MRRGTARARPTAAASRDRRPRRRADRRRPARCRAAAAAARPTTGCTRAAATRPAGSTGCARSRERSETRRTRPWRPCVDVLRKSASTTSTTSSSPRGSSLRNPRGAADSVTCCRSRKAISAGASRRPDRRQLELARAIGLARDQVEDQYRGRSVRAATAVSRPRAACGGRATLSTISLRAMAKMRRMRAQRNSAPRGQRAGPRAGGLVTPRALRRCRAA